MKHPISTENQEIKKLLGKFLGKLVKKDEIINFRFIGENLPPINEFYTIQTINLPRIHALNAQGYNCYFGVLPRDGESTNLVSRADVLFIDLDSKDFPSIDEYEKHKEKSMKALGKMGIPPSIQVSTGHGVHWYWVLNDESFTTERIKDREGKEKSTCKEWSCYQEALIEFCRGDKAVKDLPRILRLPGTVNQKDRQKTIKCEVLSIGDQIYKKEQFAKLIELSEKKREQEGNKEYKKFRADGEREKEFKKAVLEILAEYYDSSDYNAFIKLALSLKSGGFPYSEIDFVFKNWENYDQEANEKLYMGLNPDGRVSFGTAAYLAKQANQELYEKKIGELQKKAKSKKSKLIREDRESCKTFLGVDEIANFIATVTEEIFDDEGNRSLKIKVQGRKDGEAIEKTIIAEAKTFVNCNLFRELLFSKGPFTYSVSGVSSHNRFLNFIHEKGRVETSTKTKHLGRIDNGFLFHNALVDFNGQVFKSCRSIPPTPIQGRKMELYIPTGNETNKEIAKAYISNLHSICKDQAWKVAGFTVASLYLNHIVDRFGHFPIAFFYGKHHTGKSSIAQSMQAFLGCHKAIPECAFGTQKSWQRIGSKFQNCIVLLNEFKSEEKSNTLLCQIHDREGYSRAKKDMSLDTDYIEVNSAYSIISTQGITGAKSEDVQSRLIEINSDDFTTNQEAMDNIKRDLEKLSCCIPLLLSTTNSKDVLSSIEADIEGLRLQFSSSNQSYESRILNNHAFCLACYNLLAKVVGGDEFGLDDAYKQIAQQVKTTKESDLGMTFLDTLQSLVAAGKITSNIATITPSPSPNLPGVCADEKSTLIFSLQEAYPFVRQLGNTSKIEISDKTTIEKALKNLGCTKAKSRKLGGNKQVWEWNIEE